MSDLMKTTKKPTLQAHKKNSAIQKKPTTLQKPANDILMLQRSVGNQAVQRLMNNGIIQAKLTIGQPNDKYEQEADRVADEVMRMPAPQVQRQSEEEEEKYEEEEMIQPKSIGEQITPLVQRQVEPEEEEEEMIQAKAEGQIPQIVPNLESKINALQGWWAFTF